jgi:hypothetical protein
LRIARRDNWPAMASLISSAVAFEFLPSITRLLSVKQASSPGLDATARPDMSALKLNGQWC